jgi:hypothetical protein
LIGGVDVRVKTMCSRVTKQMVRVALLGALVAGGAASVASAADDPNPGALTFTGSFDVPAVYFFRGLRQEADPSFTMFPAADLGIALSSGDGAVKSSTINIGLWNSLQTGSTGSDGPSGKLHYEEDFYAALNLGFGGGFGLGMTYTAYTSPNGMFPTVKELMFKVSKSGKWAPYGIIGFELSDDGQADAGTNQGTYAELGIGPSFPLGKSTVTLTVPVKFGFSLNDYYELAGEDHKFGFFDVGGLLTFPLSKVNTRFGSWNIHGGGDYLALGDTTEAFNVDADGETHSSQFIWTFGIGVSY